MATSLACQCFFTLILLFITSSPLQIHARESNLFSKVTRAEPKPETLNPKTEPENIISPSASPLPKAKTEQGYGLFGKEETYVYSPTTSNPTKSEPKKFNYVQPNGVHEKQGMSDTRFLENGRYFYDINSEKEAVTNAGKLSEDEEEGHESYYGHGYENGNRYKESRYEAGERQGMSDTRSLDNGRYFHDLGAEKMDNDRYSNNVEFYNTKNYGGEEEDEEKYENRVHGIEGKQEMSDTRFLENGRYFYDIKNERNEARNGLESFETTKNTEYYEPEKSGQGESYDSNYEEEDEVSNGYKGKSGNRYDFRSTPNKFPRYEFDSMEEYEKYEDGRSHQKEYFP